MGRGERTGPEAASARERAASHGGLTSSVLQSHLPWDVGQSCRHSQSLGGNVRQGFHHPEPVTALLNQEMRVGEEGVCACPARVQMTHTFLMVRNVKRT